MIKVINIDMDGVLADFNGRMREITGKAFEEFGVSHDAWEALKGYEKDLYLNLKPLPETKHMVDCILMFAQVHNYQTSILTALPKGNRIPLAEEHKRIWIEKHFPMFSNRFKIGAWSEDKWKHCYSQNDILIDDYHRNINDWITKGKGIAIHHKSVDNTIEQLQNLIEELV